MQVLYTSKLKDYTSKLQELQRVSPSRIETPGSGSRTSSPRLQHEIAAHPGNTTVADRIIHELTEKLENLARTYRETEEELQRSREEVRWEYPGSLLRC
jgi:hypothetical protein